MTDSRPTVAREERSLKIQSLGYIAVQARAPQSMARFATEILGAALSPPSSSDGTQYIRLDERHHRIAVLPGEDDGKLVRLGLELRDGAALADAGAALRAAGLQPRAGTAQECAERRVHAFISFLDPAGHQVELFYGYHHIVEPFRASRPMAGFKALGHVVLGVDDVAGLERFYVDVLGFKVSDYAEYMRGDRRAGAVFLHCEDRRHHTVAFGDFSRGLHHVLVELESLDDVGTAYDLAARNNVPIARTLGRHSNDHMLSFYVQSPCGVKFEYGWGGREIGEDWKICRSGIISLWGHELRIP